MRNNPIGLNDPSGLLGRPCGAEIGECIRVTKGTPAGECTGTQYDLYFGGEKTVSNCKKGKFTNKCLSADLSQTIANCRKPGAELPKECTAVMQAYINRDYP